VVANVFGMDTIWVVVIALVVLFGGSQLPKLARNTGEAMKEFRKAHAEAASSEPVQVAPSPAAASTQPSVVAPPAPALQAGTSEERVTLTRSELDALLADREARAKKQAAGPEI